MNRPRVRVASFLGLVFESALSGCHPDGDVARPRLDNGTLVADIDGTFLIHRELVKDGIAYVGLFRIDPATGKQSFLKDFGAYSISYDIAVTNPNYVLYGGTSLRTIDKKVVIDDFTWRRRNR